jgi:AraC family transcriptional regulator of adaptative response/methylated-DNA-[protein]-cysteine methyltransferase
MTLDARAHAVSDSTDSEATQLKTQTISDSSAQRSAIAERLADEIQRQVDSGAERLEWRALQRLAHVGPRQIDRLLHERFLTTAQRHMTELRTERAARLLAGGEDVLSAALQAGFSGPGRLHDALVAHRGLTPGEIRRHGSGAQIAWGLFATPLGHTLLGATERGLAWVRLGCDGELEDLLRELRGEWPEARMRHDQAFVAGYAQALLDFLEGRADSFRPEIDMGRATPLQRAVWTALRNLRVGETISYKALAARVGRPDAVRAVANACARNRLAVAIPCHRALRSDGSLAGFRWGIEWKRRLLAIEMNAASRRSMSQTAA